MWMPKTFSSVDATDDLQKDIVKRIFDAAGVYAMFGPVGTWCLFGQHQGEMKGKGHTEVIFLTSPGSCIYSSGL